MHAIYGAMLKRQAAEGIEAQKRQMTAAIYSNPNYGSDDITKAVEGLDEHYKKALESIYPKPGAQERKQRQQEPDWNNPFWAGAASSYAKQREALERMRAAGDPRASVADVAKLEEKRAERMQMYDQTKPNK